MHADFWSAAASLMLSACVPSLAMQVPLAFYQQQPSKLFDINCVDDFAGWEL